MTPILMTVPHTGSHSALALFEQHFTRFYFEECVDEFPAFWFAHVDTERCAEARGMMHAGAGPLVMTLVEPLANIRSHLKRGKELDHVWRNWWRNFWTLEPDAIILPMDSPDRDLYLKLVGDELGVEFVTDWERRGTWQGEPRPVERGMNEREALEFLGQFPFDKYGYEINGDDNGKTL